jgi:hypothetical protein
VRLDRLNTLLGVRLRLVTLTGGDDFAVRLREDAACEVRLLMSALPPEVLTGVEILAVLAILRGAKERLDAQQRPVAPVLKLVRPVTRKRRSKATR